MNILTSVADMSAVAGTEMAQIAICRELVNCGHKVSVVYGRSGPMEVAWREFATTLVRVSFGRDWQFPRMACFQLASCRRSGLEKNVVYIHHSGHIYNLAVAVAAKSLVNARLVVHNHLPYGGHYHVPEKVLGTLGRYCDGVIFVSEAMQRLWNAAGFCPSRQTIIYNGVDTDVFAPASTEAKMDNRARRGIGSDEFVLVMAGRLVAEKGVGVLCRSWIELVNRNPRWPARLVVVGEANDPDIRATLRNLPKALHLPWMDDIREAYMLADVVVLPSIWEEPFGLILIEALASECPVIATDTGGIREALGSWGMEFPECIVPRNDFAALAQTIRIMSDLPGERIRHLGQQGRLFVESDRSLRDVARKVNIHLGEIAVDSKAQKVP